MKPEEKEEMTQNSDEKKEESTVQEQTPKAEPVPDGLPKTQEELNALIEKRLARERKKFAKQPAAEQPSDARNPATEEAAAEQPALPSPELETMKRELLLSQAQLAAYKSGARPEMAEDAVLLALHDAEKDGGEVTEEAVRKALDGVLKRHPEWKQDKEDGKTGGFQIGAPGGDAVKDSSEPKPSQKRWNRFN